MKASMEVMKHDARGNLLRIAALLSIAAMAGSASLGAIKNMAVVISAGSKLSDVPLADLVKMCKGTQKTWPDGKNFILVLKNPEAPEMRVAVQKLFGDAGGDPKTAIAKLKESHLIVKIVGNDEDLMGTVEVTPDSECILNIYFIDSSVRD